MAISQWFAGFRSARRRMASPTDANIAFQAVSGSINATTETHIRSQLQRHGVSLRFTLVLAECGV